jgi:hypothetical protein
MRVSSMQVRSGTSTPRLREKVSYRYAIEKIQISKLANEEGRAAECSERKLRKRVRSSRWN